MLFVSFGDTHCGSPVGIMPRKQYQFANGNVTPNERQKIIWDLFYSHTETVGNMRMEDERLIVVFMGDATEGKHHGNTQLVTPYTSEQEIIFTDVLDIGLQNMKFDVENGDRLYFVRGTASHAGESEERLAADFDAVPYCENTQCHPVLKLSYKGVRLWYMHKLAGAGRGANRGNALRNRARDYVIDHISDAIATGNKPALPRYLISAHYHQKRSVPYEIGDHEARASILPTYKMKDNWTFGVAPLGLGDIGMQWVRVDEQGNDTWGWLAKKEEQVGEISL